jgi:hypothetical protein
MALKITRGKVAGPVRAVLYGTEGIGKSTLAAQWPDPLILDTEDGTGQIDCARVVCHDCVNLESAMLDIAGDPQGFKTVVIDSVDWMERQVIDHVCKKAGKRSIEDFGFGKGYVMLAEYVGRILGVADQLIAAGLHVLFVGHAKVVRTSPPDETDGYDRYELKLTKHSSPIVKEWCDLLLFANYRMKLVEGTDGRKKGLGGKERILYAERSAAWDAKNRFGLPESFPMTIDRLSPIFASVAGTGSAPTPSRAEPSGIPQIDVIADTIRAATTVKKLGRIVDRVDELLSQNKITSDQWSELTDLANARHEEIEPQASGVDTQTVGG